MANIRSSEKSIRKTKTRTLQNQARKSRVRTLRKKVLVAVQNGDAALTQQYYNEFASAADKAVKSNTLHKNTAARLKSRIAKQISKGK